LTSASYKNWKKKASSTKWSNAIQPSRQCLTQ
jgi:hypothetical protein